MSEREWVIYTLSCPISGDVRYVGKTHRRTSQRYSGHISSAKTNVSSHRVNWIRSLVRVGLRPTMNIVERGIGDDWIEREKYWISFYKPTGLLTNATDGGEGAPGQIVSPENRARQAERMRRRVVSAETRRRTSIAKMGRNNPSYGRSPSAATRYKKSMSSGTAVTCVETGESFPSIRVAAKSLGIGRTTACNSVLYGRSGRGFTLRRATSRELDVVDGNVRQIVTTGSG